MTDRTNASTPLAASYDAAVKAMRDNSASFTQAFSRLPPERFRAVAAVYAFCRAADDISDEPGAGTRQNETIRRLDQLEAEVERFYGNIKRPLGAGEAFDAAWWPALTDAIIRFDIPEASFLRQIEGQRLDAALIKVGSLEELIGYARCVAGSVGTMLLPILASNGVDAKDPLWADACESLGIGMQLTNILRDVGEDLRLRNRVYLPEDMMQEYGVSRAELAALAARGGDEHAPSIPDGFKRLWERLSTIAGPYYGAVEEFLARFHPDCRLPLIAAARVYRAIEDAVRAADYDCFTARRYVSRETRDAILVGAEAFVKSRAR
jgi:phytoene synthase